MNATNDANKYDTSATEEHLNQVRDKIRFKHYSLSAENTYLSWIKQFILYHGKRHPVGMDAAEVESFLTYLATQRHVSSSTQNQALSAILFCIATTMIYTHVLNKGGRGVLTPLDQLWPEP